MDRFKSPRIQTDADLLKVMVYIDMNPKRAHMVENPRDYEWTSYHYYAHGKGNPLITPAPSYLALGFTNEERQKSYRALIDEILKNDWKQRKPYSSVPFIGNPDWVIRKNQELKKIELQNKEKWKEKKLAGLSP